jgi:hypothetical protein
MHYNIEKKRILQSIKVCQKDITDIKFIRHLKQGGTIDDYEPPF